MLKRLLFLSVLLTAVVVISGRLTAHGLHDATIDEFFSPATQPNDLDCKSALIAELDGAKQRIFVEAWRFTDREIVSALLRAKAHGVQVAVVLDPGMETDPLTQAPNLITVGIPTVVDDRHAYMHNTVFLIDSDEVITGSYSPTPTSARWNAEGILIVHSAETAAAYAADFAIHAGHSRPFIPGGPPVLLLAPA